MDESLKSTSLTRNGSTISSSNYYSPGEALKDRNGDGSPSNGHSKLYDRDPPPPPLNRPQLSDPSFPTGIQVDSSSPDENYNNQKRPIFRRPSSIVLAQLRKEMELKSSWWSGCSSFSKSLGISLLVLIIATVVLCVLFAKSQNFVDPFERMTNESVGEESDGPQRQSSNGWYEKGALSSDTTECSSIGKRILWKGGSAVDASIAMLFCMGIVIPESLGIGGGSFWTIFNAKDGKVTVIDAREEAPSYATDDMFDNNTRGSVYGIDAIGVPGELAGYWAVHEKFGRLPWNQLIQPSIDLAREGFFVGDHLHNAITQKWKVMGAYEDVSQEMKELFTDPDTLEPLKAGDRMKREDIAKTLEMIQREGAKTLYTRDGQLVKMILTDLRQKGSRMTLDDFVNYEVRLYTDVLGRNITLPSGLTVSLYTSPLPSSGPIFGFIVDSVSKYFARHPSHILDEDIFNRVIVETWKFAYAQRALLGDPQFETQDDPSNTTIDAVNRLMSDSFSTLVAGVASALKETKDNESFYYDIESLYKFTNPRMNMDEPRIQQVKIDPFKEDEGTSAMTVIDEEGNAVAVTSTVNAYFGSLVLSPSTGIIMNNQMDDFSSGFINEYGVKGHGFNRVKRGKRPFSSMCPTIITRQTVNGTQEVILAIGASGGTQITSSTSMVTLKALLNNSWTDQEEKRLFTLQQGIDHPRIHHQLWPMKVRFEKEVATARVDYLEAFGHVTEMIDGRGSVVMAIMRHPWNGTIEAVSDFRKGGKVDGY